MYQEEEDESLLSALEMSRQESQQSQPLVETENSFHAQTAIWADIVARRQAAEDELLQLALEMSRQESQQPPPLVETENYLHAQTAIWADIVAPLQAEEDKSLQLALEMSRQESQQPPPSVAAENPVVSLQLSNSLPLQLQQNLELTELRRRGDIDRAENTARQLMNQEYICRVSF